MAEETFTVFRPSKRRKVTDEEMEGDGTGKRAQEIYDRIFDLESEIEPKVPAELRNLLILPYALQKVRFWVYRLHGGTDDPAITAAVVESKTPGFICEHPCKLLREMIRERIIRERLHGRMVSWAAVEIKVGETSSQCSTVQLINGLHLFSPSMLQGERSCTCSPGLYPYDRSIRVTFSDRCGNAFTVNLSVEGVLEPSLICHRLGPLGSKPLQQQAHAVLERTLRTLLEVNAKRKVNTPSLVFTEDLASLMPMNTIMIVTRYTHYIWIGDAGDIEGCVDEVIRRHPNEFGMNVRDGIVQHLRNQGVSFIGNVSFTRVALRE